MNPFEAAQRQRRMPVRFVTARGAGRVFSGNGSIEYRDYSVGFSGPPERRRPGVPAPRIDLEQFFNAVRDTLRRTNAADDVFFLGVDVRFVAAGRPIAQRTFNARRFLEQDFADFRRYIQAQLTGENADVIGTDPLVNDIDGAEISLDTGWFSLKIAALFELVRERGALIVRGSRRVRQRFQNVGPGPRDTTFKHPKGFGPVWDGWIAKLYREGNMTMPDDGDCVIRLARLVLGREEAEVLFMGEGDCDLSNWDLFERHLREKWDVSVLRVDPCKVGLPMDDFIAGDTLNWVNDPRVAWSGQKKTGLRINFPLHPTIANWPHRFNGPFPGVQIDEHGVPILERGGVLPVLWQRDHVDLPVMNHATGLLVPVPNKFWWQTDPITRESFTAGGKWRALCTVSLVVKTYGGELVADTDLRPLALRPNPFAGEEGLDLDRLAALAPTVYGRFSLKPYATFNQLKDMAKGLQGRLYMAFDYETCADRFGAGNPHVPVLLTVSWATEEELFRPHPDYDHIYQHQSRVFYNVEGNFEFLRWLRDDPMFQGFEEVVLLGFNNAKFDNYLLLQGAAWVAAHDRTSPLYIGGLHQSGSKIFSFTLNHTIQLFDITLHAAGVTLATAVKKFGVPERFHKMSNGPGFYEVQKAWAEFGPDVWTQGPAAVREDFVEYAKMDSMCTLVLFRNLRMAQLELGMTELKPTIGQQMMASLTPVLKQLRRELEQEELAASHTPAELKELDCRELLQTLSTDMYLEMRKNLVAGAVKLPKGPVVRRGVPMMSLDETSQYPTSMMIMENSWFPIGKADHLEPGQDPDLSKEGFYIIDVDQKAVWEQYEHVIHPYKEMRKSMNNMGEEVWVPIANHWEPDPDNEDQPDHWKYQVMLFRVGVQSETLRTMMEFQCPLTIHGGWEWRNKIRGSRLFALMKGFMDKKNEIDSLPPEQQNLALRAYCKLAMNSLSGKLNQRAYMDSMQLAHLDDLKWALLKAAGKAGQGGQPTGVTLMGAIGDYVLFQSHRTIHSAVQNNQYPIPWGMKIYDLSRMRMFRLYCCANKSVLYSDTDSAKGLVPDLAPLVRHLRSKLLLVAPDILRDNPAYGTNPMYGSGAPLFGHFDDELAGMSTDSGQQLFVAVAKKTWAYWDGTWPQDENDEGSWKKVCKVGIKGVRRNDVWFKDMDELTSFIEERGAIKDEYGEYAAFMFAFATYDGAPMSRRFPAVPQIFADLIEGKTQAAYALTFSMAHVIRGRHGGFGNELYNLMRTKYDDDYQLGRMPLYTVAPQYRIKKTTLNMLVKHPENDQFELADARPLEAEEPPPTL